MSLIKTMSESISSKNILEFTQSFESLGVLKSQYEDFIVIENLGFFPSGDGEHIFVYLEKKGLNTEEVAKILAKFASVSVKNVSFSGMKDKDALTQQWYSIHLPGKIELNWQAFDYENIKILKVSRHHKKLKLGTHKSNSFEIILRQCDFDYEKLPVAVSKIRTGGVPNYYGAQRFGKENSNLIRLCDWLNGQIKPSFKAQKWLLSVYRSFLFNQYLAYRIKENRLFCLLEGDVVKLNHSNSLFEVTSDELQSLNQRYEFHDLMPTGPLWGRKNKLVLKNEAEILLEKSLEAFKLWLDHKIIDQFRLDMDFRSLVLFIDDFHADYNLNENHLKLKFSLPAGGFATAVIDYLSKLTKR